MEDLERRVERLERELARVLGLYEKSIGYGSTDPETALFQARKAAEAICYQIYRQEGLEEKHKGADK